MAGVRWRHRCRRSNGDICTLSQTGEGSDLRHTCGVCRVDTKGTRTDVFNWASTKCLGTTILNLNLCTFGDNVDTGLCAKRLHVPTWQWTLAEQDSLVVEPENTLLTYCRWEPAGIWVGGIGFYRYVPKTKPVENRGIMKGQSFRKERQKRAQNTFKTQPACAH